MATSTAAPGTLVPSPSSTTQHHGMSFFWLIVAMVVGGTALLATWVISQPDSDTVSDSASTSTITGGLSPRAADHRDAQILQRSGTSSAPVLSPNAADFRDAQAGVQRATSPGPVSPNAIDRRDGFEQSSSSGPVSPNAADYRDRRGPQ